MTGSPVPWEPRESLPAAGSEPAQVPSGAAASQPACGPQHGERPRTQQHRRLCALPLRSRPARPPLWVRAAGTPGLAFLRVTAESRAVTFGLE